MGLSEIIRQRRGSSVSLPDTKSRSVACKQVAHGILVVAPPERLLYMDQTASELVGHVGARHHGAQQPRLGQDRGPLQRALTEMSANVFHHLKTSTHAQDPEPLQVTRMIRTDNYSVLVRGFGTLGHAGPESARAVFMLGKVRPDKD